MLGSVLHKCLETIVTHDIRLGPMNQATATKLLDPIIEEFRETVTRMVPSDTPTENGEKLACLAEVLSHSWTRITYPWLMENYGYGSTNQKAYEIADQAVLANLGISDPTAVLDGSLFFKSLDPEYEKKYQALFTDVQAGG